MTLNVRISCCDSAWLSRFCDSFAATEGAGARRLVDCQPSLVPSFAGSIYPMSCEMSIDDWLGHMDTDEVLEAPWSVPRPG